MPVGHIYVFFGKKSNSSPVPIFQSGRLEQFFFFFFFDVELYEFFIFNIDLLLDISFANVSSHSVGCIFVLLIVSFAVQTLF